MSTAVVTGASSGIGLEIARILAQDHDVVLAARSVGKLEALANELGNARVVAVDLSDPAGPRKLTAEVPAADVLVNNAGFGDWGPFVAAPDTKLDEMIELNVGALTRLTHAYLPGMVERGHGRVMNVASTAAFQPGPLMAVYYTTKAYVLSLSEALAEETARLRRHGDGVVPRSDGERVPVRRHDGGEPPRQGAQAARLRQAWLRTASRP